MGLIKNIFICTISSILYSSNVVTSQKTTLTNTITTTNPNQLPNYEFPTLSLVLNNEFWYLLRNFSYPLILQEAHAAPSLGNQTVSTSGVTAHLNNVKLTNLSFPEDQYTINWISPDNITATINNINAVVNTDYNINAPIVGTQTGNGDITIDKTNVNVNIGLTTLSNGTPQINVTSSKVTIGSLSISLAGNSFLSSVANSLSSSLQSQVQSQLNTVIGQQAQTFIDKYSAEYYRQYIQVSMRGENYTLYDGFTNYNQSIAYNQLPVKPINSTTNYVGILFTAAQLINSSYNVPLKSDVVTPATWSALHNTPNDTLITVVSQTLVNSLLYAAASSNYSYTVNSTKLPSTVSQYLSTSTLSIFVPQLANQPSAPISITLSPAFNNNQLQAPNVTFLSNNSAIIDAPIDVVLHANNQNVISVLASLTTVLYNASIITNNNKQTVFKGTVQNTNINIVDNGNALTQVGPLWYV